MGHPGGSSHDQNTAVALHSGTVEFGYGPVRSVPVETVEKGKWVWIFFSVSRYTTWILLQIVDGCAFRVYGHWVKKGEGQNRAALFENSPKTELKHIYVTNLSR